VPSILKWHEPASKREGAMRLSIIDQLRGYTSPRPMIATRLSEEPLLAARYSGGFR
jgi:hypothetical protein